VHAEDADICYQCEEKVKASGRADLGAWAEARPALACLIRSMAAAEIARATQCPLYVVHVTTREEVALLRRLKREGLPIIGEAVIHYLTHTADLESRHGCLPKVIPSIKSEADRLELWRGLADGTLTTVGTDHCARPRDVKLGPRGEVRNNIWSSLPGMPGMEYLLPVMMTWGVRAGLLSIEEIARLCSENPARAFGLYPRKGVLTPGADADIIIVDPLRKQIVDEEYHLGSVRDWSIYDGYEFVGLPVTTILRGRVMVENGEVVGSSGVGRYVGTREGVRILA
jgi:allantoinase